MDDLAAFFDEARRRLALHAESTGLAVASVVRTRGSTPRKTGARLLVDPVRGSLGTVGGGCGEAEVLGRAQRTLATGESQLIEVSLLEQDGFESPSICGGVLDVFVERFAASIGGISQEDFFSSLDAMRAVGSVVVATVIEGPQDLRGRKTLIAESGDQRFAFGSSEVDGLAREIAGEALQARAPVASLPDGPVRVYAEPIAEAPEVVVIGAGHVGAALCGIAARAGFAVTVLDDRSTFANPQRLPEASRILVGDPRVRLEELGSRSDRHFVLVTRGHRLDAECLRVVLGFEAAYVGMIGSRRRVRRIREWLVEQGVSPERLEALHAPIGLDIGAETPAEIAIAIVAEIIAGRRAR